MLIPGREQGTYPCFVAAKLARGEAVEGHVGHVVIRLIDIIGQPEENRQQPSRILAC